MAGGTTYPALSGLPMIGIKLRRSTSNLTFIPLRSSFALGKLADDGNAHPLK